MSRLPVNWFPRTVRLDGRGIAHRAVVDVAAGVAWFVCDAQGKGPIPRFSHGLTDGNADMEIDCMACVASEAR
jgi:hypothetical protein